MSQKGTTCAGRANERGGVGSLRDAESHEGRAWPATEFCIYSDCPIVVRYRVARSRIPRRRRRERRRRPGGARQGRSRTRAALRWAVYQSGSDTFLRYESGRTPVYVGQNHRKPGRGRSGFRRVVCKKPVHKSLFYVEEIGPKFLCAVEKSIYINPHRIEPSILRDKTSSNCQLFSK